MSYQEYESSQEGGTPVELYHFEQGAKQWFFSSNGSIIQKDTNLYSPTPVKRDRLKQSPEVFKNGLRLTFPRDNEFARQFLGFAPEEVTRLTIYRGHPEDPDQEFVLYWKGRVAGARSGGNEINLDCESIFTSLRRPGLRAKFEYTCRHTLYRKGCNVGQGSYQLQGTVSGLGGGIAITIVEASSKVDGYFTGGMILLSDGTSRFITNHSGSVVYLTRPIQSLKVGQVVSIFPGCDHTLGTCKNKFDNLNNYGGFPYIPQRNPFDGTSLY